MSCVFRQISGGDKTSPGPASLYICWVFHCVIILLGQSRHALLRERSAKSWVFCLYSTWGFLFICLRKSCSSLTNKETVLISKNSAQMLFKQFYFSNQTSNNHFIDNLGKVYTTTLAKSKWEFHFLAIFISFRSVKLSKVFVFEAKGPSLPQCNVVSHMQVACLYTPL